MPPRLPPWTAAEYLEYENSSSTRHEFYAGMVVAMAGGSENHALIATNLLIDLRPQLEDSPCRPVSHDVRLANPESNSYFHPDLLIRCPEGGIDAAQLQPRVVNEILSPTTAAMDRDFKRRAYLSSPSIRDYPIVSQDRMFIEHDNPPQLPSIACFLDVARMDRRIDLR